jgi:hypothetical protein
MPCTYGYPWGILPSGYYILDRPVNRISGERMGGMGAMGAIKSLS